MHAGTSEMPEHAILGQWARERRVGAGQCRVWWSECESPGWVDVQLDSCIRRAALGGAPWHGVVAQHKITKPGGKGLGPGIPADSSPESQVFGKSCHYEA